MDAAELSPDEILHRLDSGALRLRYQPIVRLSDRAVVGFEALARLEHPLRGTLPPRSFVPPLEQHGHGWALFTHVLATALTEWSTVSPPEETLTLSLNTPLDVLCDPLLPDLLRTSCQRIALAPNRLVLELTETQAIPDADLLRRPLTLLRRLGVALAVDDILPVTREPGGLLGLPFGTLKLDKRVVREAADSTSARAFIRSSLAIGRTVGMQVVAEGVEDAAIWDRMTALGCDQAQGFFIARPLPAAAIGAWRAAWSGG